MYYHQRVPHDIGRQRISRAPKADKPPNHPSGHEEPAKPQSRRADCVRYVCGLFALGLGRLFIVRIHPTLRLSALGVLLPLCSSRAI